MSEEISTSRTFDADEVKALSRAAGADIVGIASAETLNAYPPDPRWPQTPERISPDAKSVIILGMRVPVASFRTREPEPYQMMNMMILRRLDVVARRVSEALERRGFSGLVMNSNGSDWELKSGTYGPLSLRHLAVEAGLGTLGLGVNFMCVEYGPRVNLSVVTTDAEFAGQGCNENFVDAVLGQPVERAIDPAIAAQRGAFGRVFGGCLFPGERHDRTIPQGIDSGKPRH